MGGRLKCSGLASRAIPWKLLESGVPPVNRAKAARWQGWWFCDHDGCGAPAVGLSFKDRTQLGVLAAQQHAWMR